MSACRRTRIHTSIGILMLSACVLRPADGQSVAMPEWLAPFAQARGLSAAAGASSYTASAPAALVISHYQEQMRAAGVAFETKSDGIGVSLVASGVASGAAPGVASKEKISAVVRIREDGGETKVKVTYAVKADSSPDPSHDPPAGAPPTAQTAGPAPAATAQTRRAPTSPFARTPYTWIMQSVRLPGTSPVRYSAFYYEAPTDASKELPLALPVGATIIDVFPQDCAFTLQDQASHSLTFKKAEEAKGKELGPGAWSLYPIKCSGIDVYLR